MNRQDLIKQQRTKEKQLQSMYQQCRCTVRDIRPNWILTEAVDADFEYHFGLEGPPRNVWLNSPCQYCGQSLVHSLPLQTTENDSLENLLQQAHQQTVATVLAGLKGTALSDFHRHELSAALEEIASRYAPQWPGDEPMPSESPEDPSPSDTH